MLLVSGKAGQAGLSLAEHPLRSCCHTGHLLLSIAGCPGEPTVLDSGWWASRQAWDVGSVASFPGQRAGASVKTAAGTGDGWADVEPCHVGECYSMMRGSSKPTLVAPVLMKPGPGSRCLGGAQHWAVGVLSCV